MSKSKVGAQSVVNIRVGALAGPSDVLMLRVDYAATNGALEGNSATTTSLVKVFTLTNGQAEDLAMQLNNALRWIEGKPRDRFH